ncbi:MAG: bifunctional folylpolyglutamate synthase/dihydrofolate synthase [Candidatus Poseidoniales archaeon]
MKKIESYEEALAWLDDLNQNKIMPGLERIRKVMDLFGNPQTKIRIISIGGTNAKGSTSYNLSRTLMQTGKIIGCFTSPHIHTVRERIKINHKNINKNLFTKYIFKLRDISEKNNLRITYFEVLTALAYIYFHEKNVDYAIMEIGLGGEWDAVNIADTEIAILTTLGLDHTEYLGSNLEKIAKTKAKIVRKNSTVITGWKEKYHKYIPISKKIIKGENIKDWIKACVDTLKLSIKPLISSIPGRQETHLNFTIDTAHNEQAIKYLLSITDDYDRIILGMLKDKDVRGFISRLPKSSTILACNIQSERGATSNYISKICRDLDLECIKFNNVKEAILSIKEEKTLITGSFYTVSDARNYFKLEGYSEL